MRGVYLLLVLAAGCAGTRSSESCPSIPYCDAPCCRPSRHCESYVCEGVEWYCRETSQDHWAWQANLPCVPRPDGGGDMLPLDAGPTSCGPNSVRVGGGCQCTQGYVNQDGLWPNGCETIDPACSVVNCSKCPVGFCGQNAECRDNIKCRCISKYWLNKDDNWSNGCETYSATCSPINCNDCYTGFCGIHADCMQSNCKCVVTGWANCDGVWERSGCECFGTCVNGQCQ